MIRTLACLIFGAAICLFALTAWAAMTHQPGSYYFSDVSASSPHNHDIGYLYEQGVVGGFPDGSYGPNLPVTRQEMATYMLRAQAVLFMLTFMSVDQNFFGGYYTGQQAYLDGYITWDEYQASIGALDWSTAAACYEFDHMRDTDIERIWNIYWGSE